MGASRISLSSDLLDTTCNAPIATTSFIEAKGTTEDLEVGMISKGKLFILDLATTLDALLLGFPRATKGADASCTTITSTTAHHFDRSRADRAGGSVGVCVVILVDGAVVVVVRRTRVDGRSTG